MTFGNRVALNQVFESLSLNRDIAYIIALDAKRVELVRRPFLVKSIPPSPNYPGAGAVLPRPKRRDQVVAPAPTGTETSRSSPARTS